MHEKWMVSLFVGAIIITIVIVCMTRNKPIKQNWGSQIGMAAYPPSIDPSSYTEAGGWNVQYSGNKDTAKALLTKWYKFVGAIGPDLSGVVYALFPNIQTPASIEYYGLTAKNIRDLTAISSKLDSPQSIKTVDDVHRVFSLDAIKSMDIDLNQQPQNGMYNDPVNYGEYVNVF